MNQPTNDSDVEKARDRHWELLFAVRRSIRYHMRRQAFFEIWQRLTSGVGVVFGSAALGALLTQLGKDFPSLPIYAAAIVTLATGLDLVVGTARMAWTHAALRKRFIDLEKKLLGSDQLSEAEYALLFRERLDIEADEPPVLRALDTICHNDLVQALGMNDHQVSLPWYKLLTAQFVNWRCPAH
jgi:hypothetical protein